MNIIGWIFWILMVVWAVDNIYARATLRGWIPWICVAILGAATVAVPVLGGMHGH